jgi:hypothetical protein
VAEQVERGLDCDRISLHLEQFVRRSELAVDAFGFVRIPSAIRSDHRLHAGPDHVCVHADASDPAELEERVDEVVVAGVEVET